MVIKLDHELENLKFGKVKKTLQQESKDAQINFLEEIEIQKNHKNTNFDR